MADWLILTHGAGSNKDAPLLVAVDRAITALGVQVVRVNLAYREKRPAGSPGRGDAERDREGLRKEIEAHAGRVFLGGHSYGGRQSSMLAAEAPGLVAGLLLMSYPLHPPRRPDQMRTAHLSELRYPALFIHGTRDPFGSSEEMRAALELIPGRKKLVEMERAGHELARGEQAVERAAEKIAAEFDGFLRKL